MSSEGHNIVLILGGARSGKSTFAESLAVRNGGKTLFCATAEPLDEEMRARIEKHRASRPANWDTVEAPVGVTQCLREKSPGYSAVIIDCVTLLAANLLGDAEDAAVAEKSVLDEIGSLAELMKNGDCDYIIVSNEVGSGLVPENRLARIYRDTLGKANQLLASTASQVYLMTAGIPLKIK